MFATTGLNADASHIAPEDHVAARPRSRRPTEQAAVMAPVGGYLLGWLTGLIAQDHANASSTLLYDIRRRAWSEAMLEASGIDPAPLRRDPAVARDRRHLRAGAAQRLGLTTHCQVVVGSGDEHAASLGAGAALAGHHHRRDGHGRAGDRCGRRARLRPRTARRDPRPRGRRRLSGREPRASSPGGARLWLSGTVLGTSQAEVFDLPAKVPAGSDGVLFLPTLCGATAPRWNDRIRGVFAGLSLNHDRGHLARAVLEGCAFALRDIVQRLDEMGLGGPGDPRRRWRCPQPAVDADQGRRDRETGARGAHQGADSSWARRCWAGSASGLFADAEDAVARVVELASEPIPPSPDAVAVYDEAYREVPRPVRCCGGGSSMTGLFDLEALQQAAGRGPRRGRC